VRIRVYKIRTYAQLDTWSRGTKQSQTKPISPDLPLPARHKTSLTSCLRRTYTTTPQSQKQSQTNPISPPASKELTNQAQMRHHVFEAGNYNTASGVAERPSNNMGPRRLKGSAIIRTTRRSSAARGLRVAERGWTIFRNKVFNFVINSL